MNCPVCKTELRITDRQGIKIDHCPQCRGVWLDRGELDKLIDRALDTTARPADELASRPRPYRRDDDDDDDDDDRRYHHSKSRRRKSLLGELFDF